MKKRITAALLSLVMLLGMFPVSTFAAAGQTSDQTNGATLSVTVYEKQDAISAGIGLLVSGNYAMGGALSTKAIKTLDGTKISKSDNVVIASDATEWTIAGSDNKYTLFRNSSYLSGTSSTPVTCTLADGNDSNVWTEKNGIFSIVSGGRSVYIKASNDTFSANLSSGSALTFYKKGDTTAVTVKDASRKFNGTVLLPIVTDAGSLPDGFSVKYGLRKGNKTTWFENGAETQENGFPVGKSQDDNSYTVYVGLFYTGVTDPIDSVSATVSITDEREAPNAEFDSSAKFDLIPGKRVGGTGGPTLEAAEGAVLAALTNGGSFTPALITDNVTIKFLSYEGSEPHWEKLDGRFEYNRIPYGHYFGEQEIEQIQISFKGDSTYQPYTWETSIAINDPRSETVIVPTSGETYVAVELGDDYAAEIKKQLKVVAIGEGATDVTYAEITLDEIPTIQAAGNGYTVKASWGGSDTYKPVKEQTIPVHVTGKPHYIVNYTAKPANGTVSVTYNDTVSVAPGDPVVWDEGGSAPGFTVTATPSNGCYTESIVVKIGNDTVAGSGIGVNTLAVPAKLNDVDDTFENGETVTVTVTFAPATITVHNGNIDSGWTTTAELEERIFAAIFESSVPTNVTRETEKFKIEYNAKGITNSWQDLGYKPDNLFNPNLNHAFKTTAGTERTPNTETVHISYTYNDETITSDPVTVTIVDPRSETGIVLNDGVTGGTTEEDPIILENATEACILEKASLKDLKKAETFFGTIKVSGFKSSTLGEAQQVTLKYDGDTTHKGAERKVWVKLPAYTATANVGDTGTITLNDTKLSRYNKSTKIGFTDGQPNALTITVKPADGYYFDAIEVKRGEDTLNYTGEVTDPAAENTFTVAANQFEDGDTVNVTVTFKKASVEIEETAEVKYTDGYLPVKDNNTGLAELIVNAVKPKGTPEAVTDGTPTVEYLVGKVTRTGRVSQEKTVTEYWIKLGDAKTAATEIVHTADYLVKSNDFVFYDIDEANTWWGTDFCDDGLGSTETVRVSYSYNGGTITSNPCELLIDGRTRTQMTFNYTDFEKLLSRIDLIGKVIPVRYGESLAQQLFSRVSVVTKEGNTSVVIKPEDITVEPESLNVSLLEKQQVKVTFKGNETYSACHETADVYVLQHEADLDVESKTITYSGAPYDVKQMVNAEPDELRYFTVTAGIQGDAASFVSLDISESAQESLTVDLYELITAPMRQSLENSGVDDFFEYLKEHSGGLLGELIEAGEGYSEASIKKGIVGTVKAVDPLAVIDADAKLNLYATMVAHLNNTRLTDFSTSVEGLLNLLKTKIGDKTVGEYLGVNTSVFGKILDLLTGNFEGADTALSNATIAAFAKQMKELSSKFIISIGKQPSEAGVYWVSALSSDLNYELSYGLGQLTVLPKTENISLQWNDDFRTLKYNGENLVKVGDEEKTVTDFGAKLVDASPKEGEQLSKTQGATTEHVYTEFFRVPGEIQDLEVAANELIDYFKGINLSDITDISKIRENLKNANELRAKWISSEAITQPGTYIEVAFVLGGNYFAMPIARVYKINYKEVTISALKLVSEHAEDELVEAGDKSYTIVYDGQPHEFTATDAVGNDISTVVEKDRVTYTYFDMLGNLIPVINFSGYPTNVGEYKIVVTVLGDEMYDNVVETFTVTILPQQVDMKFADPRNGIMSWTDAQDFNFGYKIDGVDVSDDEIDDKIKAEIEKMKIRSFFGGAVLELVPTIDRDPIRESGIYMQIGYNLNPNYAIDPIYRLYIVADKTVSITGKKASVPFNGKPQGITPVVTTEDGKDISKSPLVYIQYVGKDVFGKSYNSTNPPTNAGEYKAIVYYNGVADIFRDSSIGVVDLTITPADISDPAPYVITGVENVYYNGEDQPAQFVVSSADGKTVLFEGRDYEVSYKLNDKVVDPKDAGKYEIIVTGMGNYAGTISTHFTIAQKPLTITTTDNRITTGTPITDELIKGLFALDETGIIDGDEVSIDLDNHATFTVKKGNEAVSEAMNLEALVTEMKKAGAGTYEITLTAALTGEDADNYAVEPTAATLTVYTPSYSSTTYYKITCGEGVTANKKTASSGATVTLTVEEGYGVPVVTTAKGKSVTVTEKGNGTYTFKMPASNVTVSVTEAEAPADTVCEDFFDVNVDAWYHEGVHYCLDNELMNGFPDGTFQPNGSTTRAQIVVMLWRMAGSPVVNYAHPFTDVEDGYWYTEAVRWAAAENVAKGISETEFAPNAPVTREQLAAMLYRYAQYKGQGFTGDWMFLLDFSDREKVSSWAYEAVCWCSMKSIVTGRTETEFVPGDKATRAEVAAMFQRFCENILAK